MTTSHKLCRRFATTLAAVVCCVVSAAAQDDRPLFYTWRVPCGNAQSMDSILVMAGADAVVHPPNTVAHQLAELVLNYQGGPNWDDDRAAFLIKGWRPNLNFHPEDALENDGIPNHDKTPWTLNGQFVVEGWMQQFVNEWRGQQELHPSLPDPTRIYIDKEDFWNKDLDFLFGKWSRDPRWYSEPLHGFDQTLCELYATWSGGEYQCQPPYVVANYYDSEFAAWWLGTQFRLFEELMATYAYDVLTHPDNFGPDLACGNFMSSVRLDGRQGGDGELARSPRRVWLGYNQKLPHWRGRGTRQTPCLFDFAYSTVSTVRDRIDPTDPPTSNLHEAAYDQLWVYWARRLVNGCIDSFGGNHADEVVPWICLPGFGIGHPKDPDNPEYTDPPSHAAFRRLLAMLRAKRVNEVIAYNGTTGVNPIPQWNAFAYYIDQVWSSHVDTAPIVTGETVTGVEKLFYSDRDFYEITPQVEHNRFTARTQIVLRTDFAQPPERVRLALELAVTSPGAYVRVSILNLSGAPTWDLLDDFHLPAQSRRNLAFELGNPSAYVDTRDFGRVKLLVEYAGGPTGGAYTARIDFAQITADDDYVEE